MWRSSGFGLQIRELIAGSLCMSGVLLKALSREGAKLKLPTLHTSSERSAKLSQSQRWFEKEVRTGPTTSSISPRSDRRHLTQKLLASYHRDLEDSECPCARRFLCLIFLFISSIVGFAQQYEHEPRTTPSVKLGKISFPTSCSSQAQSEVETGMASLHSLPIAQLELDCHCK